MNDYNELIYALKSCQHIASDCIDCPLSNTKYYNCKTKECEVHLHNIAADAIEQLVKERDEFAKTSKQFEEKCKQLESERDMAVNDFEFSCKNGLSCYACKHDVAADEAEYCTDCTFNSHFEWRGVRE